MEPATNTGQHSTREVAKGRAWLSISIGIFAVGTIGVFPTTISEVVADFRGEEFSVDDGSVWFDSFSFLSFAFLGLYDSESGR